MLTGFQFHLLIEEYFYRVYLLQEEEELFFDDSSFYLKVQSVYAIYHLIRNLRLANKFNHNA